MAKLKFTDAAIRELPAPAKGHRIDYDLGTIRGFAVQTTYTGAKRFLLVYVAKATGLERRLVIGEFGPPPRLSLDAARRRAKTLRAAVDLGGDPWLEGKQARAQAEAAAVRDAATLGNLLAAYVAHLKAAGKPSWREVETAVDRNLIKPFPRIAALPADQVGEAEVLPALRRLTRAGKWRAAEKLAVYMRAAYAAAKAARLDAGAVAFEGFDLRTNPLQDLRVSRPDAGAESGQSGEDALGEADLRTYWKAIKDWPAPHGALLRLHLLSGGQRMEQLSRATVRDLDEADGTLTLWDTKGRRKKARRHVVPLLPEARAAIDAMRGEDPQGPYIFTVSRGAAAAVPHTLAAAMRRVAAATGLTLTPGTIRRTVETRLAAARIPKDWRAHLQSHGLGGVQDRDYDRHHYIDEKREALEKLRALLEPVGTAGNVTKLRRRAG